MYALTCTAFSFSLAADLAFCSAACRAALSASTSLLLARVPFSPSFTPPARSPGVEAAGSVFKERHEKIHIEYGPMHMERCLKALQNGSLGIAERMVKRKAGRQSSV